MKIIVLFINNLGNIITSITIYDNNFVSIDRLKLRGDYYLMVNGLLIQATCNF